MRAGVWWKLFGLVWSEWYVEGYCIEGYWWVESVDVRAVIFRVRALRVFWLLGFYGWMDGMDGGGRALGVLGGA